MSSSAGRDSAGGDPLGKDPLGKDPLGKDPYEELGDGASAEGAASARRKALELLGRREYSRYELEKRLHQAGFAEEAVRMALGRLEEQGVVSDDRYARLLIQEKADQAWGPARIRARLLEKGIPVSVADEVLSEYGEVVRAAPGGPAEERLVEMVVRRFGRVLWSDPGGARNRAAGFVRRRGHDWETVQRVVRKAEERAAQDGEQQTSE